LGRSRGMEISFDKKFIVRATILTLLIGYFGGSLIFGNNGILRYFAVKKEIVHQKYKVVKLKSKIEELNTKIALWGQNDFELEKMAREELQMGYPDEKVYLLK
jgi:cell division protein FtsB